METVSRADAERSELWIGSVRAYNRRQQEDPRWQWIEFYRQMEQVHLNLAAEHQRKADALIAGGEQDEWSLTSSELRCR